MALRFLLVSLVAGMGFELPSGGDVATWTRAGRDWVDARMGDLSSLKAEARLAFAGAVDCEREVEPAASPVDVAPTREDLAFEAIVEKMASDFKADLATIEEPKPVDEALVIVEPFREMPPAALTDPEPAVPAPVEVAGARPEVVAPATVESASRVERISAAVSLTKQALSAWASLIQPTVRVAAEQVEDSL